MCNDNKQKRRRVLSKVIRSVKQVPTLTRNSRYLLCTRPSTNDDEKEEEAEEEESPKVTLSRENVIQSEFVQAGEIVLTRDSLTQTTPYPTTNQDIVSSVELAVSADPLYEGRLVPGPVEGYLDYYNSTSWSRGWFVLKDSSLVCWSSQEERDQEPSSLQWDLSECYKTVVNASPVDCGCKNAFIIPLSSLDSDKELLLAAESADEVEEWLTALNSIILSTSEWHTESTA